MTFGQIVDQARAGSLRKIRELKAAKEAQGFRVVLEPAPRDKGGSLAFATDGLKLPLRFDLAFRDGEGGFKTEYADSVCVAWGSSLSFPWSERFRIEARAVRWDYLDLRISVAREQLDEDELRRWFLKWFDTEDKHEPDSDGFAGVLHFVSDPKFEGGVLILVVDFGSAPVEALEALFDMLEHMGATDCIIGDADSKP